MPRIPGLKTHRNAELGLLAFAMILVAVYDVAAEGYVIVRTGETRKYGNALLRKGVVTLS